MDRTKFIGASEVASVIGISPWVTPLQLWSIKTGLVQPKDLSDNEAVEWGSRLERVVSAKFAEKNGVKLIAYKKRYVHPKYPFLTCELDNIIAGTEELVEIKTANANAYKEWKDQNQIPEHYIVQVMMQLGITGRKVGHIAVLCGGQKYLERKVNFDQKMYDDLVDRCVRFWDMVEKRIQPEAIAADNDTILDLFPKSGEVLEAIEEMNAEIKRLQELKMHLKELDEQKAEIEAKLKQVIGMNQGVKTSDYLVTWKDQISQRVDVDALKRDGIYEGYTKESKTRVLRVAKNKGE